jgi:signal transduction histidine kinase
MSRSTGRSDLPGITQPALVAERERIALELNKFTVQRLFGIGLKLQAVSSRGGDPAVTWRVYECVQELDLAITDLRRLVFNLDARNGH